MQVAVTSFTHTGNIREHNEDNVLVDESSGLCIVADGMGGHQAGEVASKLCVDTMLALLSDRKLAGADLRVVTDSVREAIIEANRVIREHARHSPGHANMGTTLALFMPCGEAGIVAHVGDSRVYQMRNGVLNALTRDHSLLQEQVGAGLISKEEARQSHNRNLVTRALGTEENVAPDIRVIDVKPGDQYLLCSDGLNTMVSDHDIELVLSAMETNQKLAAEVLVNLALDNGGHDNVSVAMAQIAGARKSAPAPSESVHVEPHALRPHKKSLFHSLFGWLFGK